MKHLSLTDLMGQVDELSRQGQTPQAIDLYQSWLELHASDPLRGVAWFNLGVLFGSLSQSQQAEQAYREALRTQPALLQARLNLGHQLELQGRLDEALREWEQALNEPGIAMPLQLHALNNMARALETARRYDEAETYMVRSLQIDPDQSASPDCP